jgi:hypothetical protein
MHLQPVSSIELRDNPHQIEVVLRDHRESRSEIELFLVVPPDGHGEEQQDEHIE